MPKDYYSILGVSKSASADEIKKAFRRLAHEHHPDKGGDASKFKDINEAYQVLGDEKKRRLFDQGVDPNAQGFSGGGYGGGFGGFDFGGGVNINMDDFDFGDVLGEMFGFAGGRGGRREKRGANIEVDVDLSFRESVFGADKQIRLERQRSCTKCKGDGAEPGTKLVECAKCHGSGQIKQNQRTMFGTFQSVTSCPDCQGKGKKPEKPCTVCRGYGVERLKQDVSIRIPSGVDNENVLQVSGEGESPIGGGRPGDLFVRVHVTKDPHFTREGNNIVSELAVPFSLLALGGSIDIPTIDGPEPVRVSESTPDGTLLTIRGKGIPYSSGSRGSHIVRLVADVPRRLSKEQKEALNRLKEQGL